MGVPLDRLSNSFYRSSAIQIVIGVVNYRRLFLAYYLAGSWNYIQFFALLKIGKARIDHRVLFFIEVFELALAFEKFPKLVFGLVANQKTLVVKLFFFFLGIVDQNLLFRF